MSAPGKIVHKTSNPALRTKGVAYYTTKDSNGKTQYVTSPSGSRAQSGTITNAPTASQYLTGGRNSAPSLPKRQTAAAASASTGTGSGSSSNTNPPNVTTRAAAAAKK